ncbi:MAG: STAS domain-containing protein [Candidatus Zixiibacteriota bacterium]
MNTTTIMSEQLTEDTIMIDPGGQLDNSNAHILSEAIARAQASGFKYIIIDMKRLEFISSAGVGSILGSVELLREVNGDIILCNASENIMYVLSVLDLTEYLTIRSSRIEAEELCGVRE